jgi:Kef-type K+ transport system membrane component KefB
MLDLRTLLLQIIVICAAARGVGWCFERLRQPRVVGEMVAGILLGPSLLGWLLPDVSSSLFPPASLGLLNGLSQIGLLLFMFHVGLTLDTTHLRQSGRAVLFTSQVSIIVPLISGGALAVYLHDRLSSDAVSPFTFALFMGTAMSVTAFPVLARILTERHLLNTSIGVIAISAAAVDDVTAWCLLAFLIATVRAAGDGLFWLPVAGLAAYLLVALCVIRPLLQRTRLAASSSIGRDGLAFLLLFMILSSWTTERIGIHALFGAFLAGVILPKNESLVHSVSERLEPLTSALLLPLFFAFTGLRTSVGVLNGAGAWMDCVLIVAVAVAGKLAGCAVTLRLTGASWREAIAVGVLMNTRGLVELVILNVGLDLGVISPTLFSMLVIMAVVTTVMASPLLDLVLPPVWLRLSLNAPPTNSSRHRVDSAG